MEETPANCHHQTVATPHGPVVLTLSSSQSGSSTTAPTKSASLLLLHSNSASSRPFQHILSRPPPGVQRVIALDFPGHGKSPNVDGAGAEKAYTQPGYAESAVAVLEHLGVENVVVLGWSLGGHVAIEMIPLLEERRRTAGETAAATTPRCLGIMIVGTPPAIGMEQVTKGFDVSGTGQVDEPPKAEEENLPATDEGGEPKPPLGAREFWTHEDAVTFASLVHGQPFENWMVETAERTDGRTRGIMFAAFGGGRGVDQRKVLETSDVLCAVVNGAKEPFVNLDYVDGIKYRNLWEQKCHRLPGLGHAPFWEQPSLFQEYLWRFVSDCISTA